jgi:hypothetical protein
MYNLDLVNLCLAQTNQTSVDCIPVHDLLANGVQASVAIKMWLEQYRLWVHILQEESCAGSTDVSCGPREAVGVRLPVVGIEQPLAIAIRVRAAFHVRVVCIEEQGLEPIFIITVDGYSERRGQTQMNI